MSGLLFVVGAFTVVLGVITVGFGVPISEFSFGNTLIIAGTTAAIGGLVVVALGVVVAQLQRLTDALATRAPARTDRPADTLEAAPSRISPAPGRIPFPPKPMESVSREPQSPVPFESQATQADLHDDESFAPTLRNPDEPPVTVEDEVSLSPRHPMAAPVPQQRQGQRQEQRQEPTLDADWRGAQAQAAPAQSRQPQTAYFDAMWPADPKLAKAPVEDKYEPKRVVEPEPSAPNLANEKRTVAILKSGVVDGMAYTLYVDGSIEAELPQGTLRFASINELRSHLENNA